MYRRGDFGQVARALRVLEALRGFKQGRWVSEVAAEVGASERTVRRDLVELQDAGFDIEVTRRENKSFACLAAERTYSPVSITRSERFTLLAVRGVFDVFKGTPFIDDVRSVMTKLEQRMSDKERAELAAFGERFVYLPDHGVKSYEGKEDIIDALQTGILSRWVVRYRYADARGRARDGFLAPFGLVLYRNGLYAIAGRLKDATSDARVAKLGMFAVERFSSAEYLRAHTFQLPIELNMHGFLHGAFGPHLSDESGPHRVVVEFSREKALLVASRTWHPKQQVDHVADGRVGCRSMCRISRRSCRGFSNGGPHARAISPSELVEAVLAELDAARAQYVSGSR